MNGTPLAPLTGLFLGAGASYELGMPLVWEVTSDLRTILTKEKLLRFNAGWKLQGADPEQPDALLEELADVAARAEQHYESVLGYLETQYRRLGQPADAQQQYHALYSWLVDVVYQILLRRHVASVEYIRQNIRFFSGVSHFITNNAPLWIFSLNHDLIVECLAAEHSVPVNSGFGSEVITLPRRDAFGAKVGDIRANVLSADDLEKSRFTFATYGSREINLLKVHGGLDVFAFRDGHDFLKMIPEEQSVAGIIETLRAANEELVYVDPRTSGRAKVTNEIAYADDAGEMQFLRRSLLAGAFKFDDRREQVLSKRFLEQFRSNLNWVTNLVCIGYSFGDVHINGAIRSWLEMTADRRIEIVDPRLESVPGFLLHAAPQVTLTKATATDYLDRVAGIVRDRHDSLMKRLARHGRTRSPSDGRGEFLAFAKQWLNGRAMKAVQEIASLPRRDGQPDLGDLTPEEYARRLSKELGLDGDAMLEAFLESVGGA